jgi:BirA family biotin operon repressor/biotin-[acetyl-CoA-carboxylase] ligase
MTRTAISPRLAIKTLVSTTGQSVIVILDERTRARLAADTRFTDVRLLDEVDSTNRYLLASAADGAPEGLVVAAEHQTAGRGRLGRTWTAPPGGSLLVSVLLRPARLPLERRHLVTAAVALAAAAACQEVAGFGPGLKWPNDLVIDDAKLAGILAEAFDGGVVVGLGLNVNWAAGSLIEGATSANLVAGHEVDRASMLASLLTHLEGRCRQLESDGGQAALAADYRAASATLGRQVRVSLSGEAELTGQAEAIDDAGHLWVRPSGGGDPAEVTAGDVVHLRSV